LLFDVEHTPELRRALENGVPYCSTLEAARWTVKALAARAAKEPGVNALQDLQAAAMCAAD
jgi:carbamoyl-phosphate synthase large subunit